MMSLKTHNLFDYAGAAFLALCPWIFGFQYVDPARAVFVTLGLSLAVYSGLTRYRYSLVKFIPLGVHMFLDAAIGVILMLAPSIFGYRDLISGSQYLLHFVCGLGALGLVAFTRPRAEESVTGQREPLKRVA